MMFHTLPRSKKFLESDPDTRCPACLIPIIFITGHGDIPMSVRAMKESAVDFLPKPFDDDDHFDAVKDATTGFPNSGRSGRTKSHPAKTRFSYNQGARSIEIINHRDAEQTDCI